MSKIKVVNVLFNILTIITLLAVIFVLFNIFAGAKGYAVTSDSMKDTLKRGDIVFSREVDFNKLEVDDIITVRVNERGYFTHRVVSVDYDKGIVETKGDKNVSKDPMPTDKKNIVGKMWYSVPLLGYITITFSHMSTAKGLVILALVAVVLIGLNMIVSRQSKKNNKKRGDINE